MRRKTRLISVFAMLLVLGGCGMFQEKIVLTPNAPVLITDTKFAWAGWIRLSGYDVDNNEMIDLKWRRTEDYLGYTLSGSNVWGKIISDERDRRNE